MSATVTLASSGAWTDFSAAADKNVAPASAIVVGHRAMLVIGSTVDGGVTPGSAGYGAIDSLSDSVGNTWNRDSSGPVDATDSSTTVEIWSCYVATQIPTSTYTVHVTPDSRGLSAFWFLLDVSGTTEDGSTSPLDKAASVAHTGFSANYASGTTAATSFANEVCVAVVSDPSSGAHSFSAASNSWTLLSNQHGTGTGSQSNVAVGYKVVAATGTQNTVFTNSASSSLGQGCIATYNATVSSGNKAVTPAAITSSSGMTGAVQALKKITPAAVSASSSMSGTVTRLAHLAPAAVTATSTATASLKALRAITTSSINATSVMTATVSGGSAVATGAFYDQGPQIFHLVRY